MVQCIKIMDKYQESDFFLEPKLCAAGVLNDNLKDGSFKMGCKQSVMICFLQVNCPFP